MKTIYTDTHILLVDETTEINNSHLKIGEICLKIWGDTKEVIKFDGTSNTCLKIIASSPKLEGVDEFETLPPNAKCNCHPMCKYPFAEGLCKQRNSFNTEVDVEKLARDVTRKKYPIENTDYPISEAIGFQKGYKQAKSETMFCLEDMKNLLKCCMESAVIGTSDFIKIRGEEYIESIIKETLTKPKRYEFIVEMILQVRHGVEWYNLPNQKEGNDSEGIYQTIPKIVNGKIQGTWKKI